MWSGGHYVHMRYEQMKVLDLPVFFCYALPPMAIAIEEQRSLVGLRVTSTHDADMSQVEVHVDESTLTVSVAIA